jgi:hypothetical protein
MLGAKAVMFVTDTVAHLIEQLHGRLQRNAAFHSIACHVRMLPALQINGVRNAQPDYTADISRISGVFASYLTLN